MYYIKLLKKYGLTAAAALMVAMMLCDTPLMVMADDMPAVAEGMAVTAKAHNKVKLRDEFTQKPDSKKKKKKNSDQKAASVKSDEKKDEIQSDEKVLVKESSEETSVTKEDVKSSKVADQANLTKQSSEAGQQKEAEEKTSAEKKDSADKNTSEDKKDSADKKDPETKEETKEEDKQESSKTTGDSSETSGKESAQEDKSDKEKETGAQSADKTEAEVKDTEKAGDKAEDSEPQLQTAADQVKDTAGAEETPAENKEDTSKEPEKTNDTDSKDADSQDGKEDAETEKSAEEEPVKETEKSGEQKGHSGEQKEQETKEPDIDLQKAPNKGKNRKNKNPDSKESRKGSEKIEKEAGEKTTEKKKEKKTSGEQAKAERDLQTHTTGVAPWKGHAVNLPDLVVKQELRFKTVKDADTKAVAKKLIVYEKKKKSSRKVGYVKAGGAVSVLVQDGAWDYIECGELRGFVKDSSLKDISELKVIRRRIEKKTVGKVKNSAKKRLMKAKMEKEFNDPAILLVETVDNKAFTYKKLTAQDTVVKKVYALVDTAAAFDKLDKADSGVQQVKKDEESTEEKKNLKVAQAESVDIKEEKSAKSRTIGTIKNGGLLYIIEDAGEDWVFVESGDVRGFIESAYLHTGKKVNKKVKKKGEKKFATARKKVDPTENKAFYYSIFTTVDKTAEQEFRETIIKAAAQCIGNPYVWGGTSLVNGADCSGFVQTLYRNYGISLPRVADDQSEVGTKVTIDTAEAGDLIFFADSSGYVYHVAISTGDGGTIEARNERFGIVRIKDRGGASWATDIISDMFQD